MDVREAIRTRRSVGRSGGDVSDAVVRELVEAATWAPNHRLTEPWRFTILSGDARRGAGDKWGESAARERGLTGEAARAFAQAQSDKFLRAPLVIVVSCVTAEDPIVAAEDHSATAAAVQNLLLEAHARGLGAMWRTGGAAYDAAVKEHLGLAQSDRIIAFVYLGAPEAPGPPPKARAVDGVIRRPTDHR